MWMPGFIFVSNYFSEIATTIVSIEYKKLLISFSYVYYATIFFLLTRVLVYFGVMLVNLINTKHTTFFKKKSNRSVLGIFVKFYWFASFKKTFLKLATITCL